MIPSFFKFKSGDYTSYKITKGFIVAFLLSSFIYLEYFGLQNKLINTIFILLAYYLLITIDKKSLFFAGFFTGLLWFWWIGYSFIYYDLVYLIPFIVLFFGVAHGVFFWFTAIIDKVVMRIIMLYLLTFFEPFGFNWFKLDLPLINTYFNTYESNIKEANLKIYMPSYNIAQDKKWDKQFVSEVVETNLANIDDAIKNGYDIVILPETAFPLPLNKEYELLEILKEKSNHISIITGALSVEGDNYLNSTYLFENSIFKIANKVVLVPFGEEIPLPKFLVTFINDTFFDGASDYAKASAPTTFTIKGIKFRNAVCYEATTDAIYQNLDTPYVIATSNNAWFTPSTEPTLQKLLLRYYAKKYHTLIYHATNSSPNMVVK
ncbi:MAG: apolipoprotein N-acyltransferase [Arcobacteraceae bacterium]|jgi:apolipoprotein N-acyltransferase|nr:apolipoprotein N-acyltransferase [Arcobacteraceae bacterium]